MLLDLRELIGGVASVVPFAGNEPATDLSDDLLTGAVRVEGKVENHAGYLSLTGEAVLEGTVRCARCCKEFPRTLVFPLEYKLAEKLANEDEEEFLLLEDGMLDLSETVRSQLLTEMPYRFLCKEDCKGLCPKCGCDLNVTRCSCDLTDRDPRWSVLGSYFDEKE